MGKMPARTGSVTMSIRLLTGLWCVTLLVPILSLRAGFIFKQISRVAVGALSKPTVLFQKVSVDVTDEQFTTSGTFDSPQSNTRSARGLLLSSFTDGLLPNPKARAFLRNGLLRCLMQDAQQAAEKAIEDSVRYSPCNGPNTEALLRLEQMDRAVTELQANRSKNGQTAQLPNDLILRFVYIPTAMYALRSKSNNTPGKQKQRARADAKQRRDEIVNLLHELLVDSTYNSCDNNPNSDEMHEPLIAGISIAAITLDLDDGSLKLSVHSPETLRKEDSRKVFPMSGKDALTEWKPHFVYIQGSNMVWLYHCLEMGSWKEDIRALFNNGNTFFCGSSAGAILAGASMETACWKEWDDPSIIPDRNTYDAWKGVAGLHLVNEKIAFFPHHVEQQWSHLVAEKSAELLERTGTRTHCLRDDQVYFMD